MRRAIAVQLLRLLLVFSLVFPSSLLWSQVSGVEVAGYPPFLIGPGDILNITVYGEKDLPSTYLVDSTGAIVFPLVGDLHLAGLTQAKAGEELARHFTKYQKDPQVTVLITETAQYTIAVLGNVARPGKYRIRGLPNLLSAIAEAGGPLAHSSLNSTVLVRGETRRELSLGDYLSASSSNFSPQPLLYPGDVLFVPRSPWPTIGEWGVIVGILTSAVVLSTAFRSR